MRKNYRNKVPVTQAIPNAFNISDICNNKIEVWNLILFSWLCHYQLPFLTCGHDPLHASVCSLHKKLWILFIYCLFVCFLGPHLWHIEVPKLRIELELQLPAYTTATATLDLSCVCELHHSSWQRQIPNSSSKVRDWTHILMILLGFINCWATKGTLEFSVGRRVTRISLKLCHL